MKMKRNMLAVMILGFFSSIMCVQALAQDGLLGVYVRSSYNQPGMVITGFIQYTPAAELAQIGRLNRQDLIISLAGYSTHNLFQLRQARDLIPPGREGRMVLLSRYGYYYNVWIGPNSGVAASQADRMVYGGQGQGSGEHIRPISSDFQENESELSDDDSFDEDFGNPDIR